MEQEIIKTFETSVSIYNHIGDSISKEIFENKIMYSITNDIKYLHSIVVSTDEGYALERKINTRNEKYIFGTGYWCNLLTKIYQSEWDGCLDNNSKKWGGTLNGINIYSPETILSNTFTGTVFIMSRKYNKEIYNQLVNGYRIPEYQIIDVGEMINSMFERQYFDISELKHTNDEVFVDAGCFDGTTSLNFIKWTRNKFKKIYCFEPSGEGIAKIKINLGKYKDKTKILPYACWNKQENLKFFNNEDVPGASKISNEGVDVKASSIDAEIPEHMKVTFIKMDVEGAELRALEGAEKTIRRCHPKLAICIYHKPEDILTLAEKIITIDDSYKLYVRHYSLSEVETVMYAI